MERNSKAISILKRKDGTTESNKFRYYIEIERRRKTNEENLNNR